MLTADLIRARVVKGEVRPRYVTANEADVRALAQVMADTFRAHLGKRRVDLDDALTTLTGEGTDYLLHRGLAKLLFALSHLLFSTWTRLLPDAAAWRLPDWTIPGEPTTWHTTLRCEIGNWTIWIRLFC